MADRIFISHSTADDPFVAGLRAALELRGFPPWVDSRNLAGGDRITPEIEAAIADARAFLVVISPDSVNSEWVYDEVELALRAQRKRGAGAFPVIPLLLPGTTPGTLRAYFGRRKTPLAIRVGEGPGALEEAMPALLAALGERLPEDDQRQKAVPARPLAELRLELTHPTIVEEAGTRRAAAEAQLIYRRAEPGVRDVESERFTFTAPLGPIEMDDLRWYLEAYPRWPIGEVYRDRAAKVVASLPEWGQSLHRAVAGEPSVQEPLSAWTKLPRGVDRRFSVYVDAGIVAGSPQAKQDEANEAATLLLALPWELLHDGRSYLHRGAKPVQVRRRLPSRRHFERAVAEPPIRVLLVSPRPEEEGVGYIDHRAIARPMVEALGELGDLAELTVLGTPTYGGLEAALLEAQERGQPFHIVHFDGHGVFDRHRGLGALCFEHPEDAGKVQGRRSETIHADDVAGLMREYRIPLVFLNACQSAQAVKDPTASVASRLLDEGVASVVAMSHTVQVATARRFVTAFYRALVGGARVGEAMLASQRDLQSNTFRRKVFGGEDLHLHDWFVPVLYQEEEDLQLFRQVPSERIAREIATQRRLRLGELPQSEKIKFVGRSRELLALERMLLNEPWVAVVGQGGEGKTTLAVELARWLVGSQRFGRAAFLSLETVRDARAAADALGRQLVPRYSVATYPGEELLGRALQPIERALRDERTVIVVDNVETALGDLTGFRNLSGLLNRLLAADNGTRLVFTSRQALPAPFAEAKPRYLRLGRLSREAAVELVEHHMPGPPPADDAERIEELVEAVNGHARSLVLLAPHVSRQGVTVTRAALSQLMAELHERYPDDRERSLYASVELSLARLPPGVRRQIRPLGVFQGGANLAVFALMTEVEPQELTPMVDALLDTHLAERMPYDHLTLHPALCPYLAREVGDEETAEWTARWAEGMVGLVDFLYGQLFQDTQLAFTLTRLELPNLMRLLEHLADAGSPQPTLADPERALGVATSVEELLARLNYPRLLRRVLALRERLGGATGGGLTSARFEARRMEIERLLQAGRLQDAYRAAQALLADSQAPGAQVSAYNRALAVYLLGRVLFAGGAAGQALPLFREAQRRFEALGEDGARTAAAVLTEQGDCLTDLGRLEEAAQAYEEGIKRAEALHDARQVAVGKAQLATVRMLQGRSAEALAAYESARQTFAGLGEPQMVATAWHQIGMVHQEAGNDEAAEEAYREALALSVQLNDRAGETNTLNQLGLLYDRMGRLEEAVTFLQQAADVYVQLGDQAKEGVARSNLANRLITLRRYDPARAEIERAIACKEPYGHAAEPWKSWDILHDLERAVGNDAAAGRARGEARRLFLAYRREGGENQSGGGRLCAAFARAVGAGQRGEMAALLPQVAEAWKDSESGLTLVAALQAILAGSRDPALAEDPALYYRDAVEVQLLLERLGEHHG